MLWCPDIPLKLKLHFYTFQAVKIYHRVTDISYVWLSSFEFFSSTSLRLPPVFSSCHFSPAGIVYFFHSWCGPSSERPGCCRLSAHSPQHTGKNGEFPPLWSSSFFKRFHSILQKINKKTNLASIILPWLRITNVRSVRMCTRLVLWGGAWGRLANVHHTYVHKSKHFPRGTAASLFIVNSPHTHKGSHPLINMQRLHGAIIHSPTFKHLTVLAGHGSVRCLLASSAVYASTY